MEHSDIHWTNNRNSTFNRLQLPVVTGYKQSHHPTIIECVENMHSNYVQFQALYIIYTLIAANTAGDRFQF